MTDDATHTTAVGSIPRRIKDLLSKPIEPDNNSIIVQGWLRTRRDSKGGFSFLQINDGSCLENLQVIADNSLEEYEATVLKLSAGCSVSITGIIKKSEGKQAIEMQANSVQLVGEIDDPSAYPISKKRHSFEFLREVAHLRPRTNTFGAVTRVRHHCAQAIHRYLDENHYYWVNTPIITASDCEGAGELFKVSTLDFCNLPLTNPDKQSEADTQKAVDFSQDFFSKQTYLTVSGQLNVEAFCLALSRVYTFGPTFRAENSNTSRHLAEFWMVEPELAFATLDDICKLSESFLKSVVHSVLDHCEDDIAFFNQRIDKHLLARLTNLVDQPFEQITYSEAIELLKDSSEKFEYPVKWGLDLQSEHERYISEKHVKGPVIVRDYPSDIKAFYMRQNDDGRTCAAMDLLAPGIGEIIGGSQREERLTQLDEKLTAHGLSEDLYWYRDLRRYGTVPHGGFGLGFERLLNYLTGLDNIRDVIPFPRAPGNAGF